MSGAIGANVSFKAIYLWAMKPNDVAHSFASSENGASSIALDLKPGGFFDFSRTEGNLHKESEKKVSAANFQGGYEPQEDGMFVFALSDSSYCAFKVRLYCDKIDGSEYRLKAYSPIDAKDLDLVGTDLYLSK